MQAYQRCAVCDQLQSVNLSYCGEVTDAGASALGAGCDQLQSIIPKGCKTVSDADISALGAGCDQLQSIILKGCKTVSDAGIREMYFPNHLHYAVITNIFIT